MTANNDINDLKRKRCATLIKALCQEKGLTQAEFGLLLTPTVRGQTVSLWLKGTLPTAHNMKQIAEMRGWTLDQLDCYLRTGLVVPEKEFDVSRALADLEHVTDPRQLVILIQGATQQLGRIAVSSCN